MLTTNRAFDRLILWVAVLVLSAYVVYEHATDCMAIDLPTLESRHNRWMEGNSEFFNPWQYRVLSPLLLELAIRTLPNGPHYAPHLLLHFGQIVLLFSLFVVYLRLVSINNPYLMYLGLMLCAFFISHSVFQSDLSFNTYFDIIFYLLAAILILKEQYVWLIPVTLLAALNRETSGFIFLMPLAPFAWRRDWKSIPKRVWLSSAASALVFAVVFVSIRAYFGYRAPEGIHGMTSVMHYLRFNLTFMRMYPELIGTFGLVPLIILAGFSRLPVVLRSWCILIVPLWIVIHLAKSTAMESRLFLVPVVLVLLPCLLWLTENTLRETKTS